MAETGALPLPVSGNDLPVGDPLLAKLGSFLQAALRYYCGDAWTAIGGKTDVCERVETNDPTDNTFVTTKLPCLALFRLETNNEDLRIADDLYESKSNVVVLWIPQPGIQNWRATRETFVRAVRAAVSAALKRERVPGWVIPGDQDPLAPIEGSNILDALNLMRPFLSVKTEDFPLVIEIDGAPTQRYPSVKFTIPISEQIVTGPLAPYLSRLNAELTTNDGLVTNAVEQS